MISQHTKKLMIDFLIDDKKTDIELLALAIGNAKSSDQRIIRSIGNRLDGYVKVAFVEIEKMLKEELHKAKSRPTLIVVK